MRGKEVTYQRLSKSVTRNGGRGHDQGGRLGLKADPTAHLPGCRPEAAYHCPSETSWLTATAQKSTRLRTPGLDRRSAKSPSTMRRLLQRTGRPWPKQLRLVV